MNKIGNIENKNILLLQGPMGSFFKRLDKKFKKDGANTFRIGFNAGDAFFSFGSNYTPYRGTEEEWNDFILNYLVENKINKIFLFGDCRFYQSIAIKSASNLNIDVYVFEEGYIRPHYITMEKHGVNDYSRISRDTNFFKQLPLKKIEKPLHANQSKTKMVLSAASYYLISNLFNFRYPHYRHHRDFSARKELFYGLRGVVRKLIYPFYEAKYLEEIENKLSKKYYFVPLQTHNDFQILEHSGYRSIEKFIIEVLESFSNNAPKNRWLIFKHHPVDRGRKNYKNFIMQQAELLGIENMILVLHDIHLPSCLEHAIGTVTINSTVGLSSVSQGTPTITLGNAIYDIAGLTCRDMPLKDFWNYQQKPDMDLFEKYRTYLIETTQLNGSFYGNMPDFKSD